MDPINDLCKICNVSVNTGDNAIVCDICNSWVHTRCNWLDKKDYKAFQNDHDKSFYCLLCMNDVMPYSKLNDNEFERISAKGEKFSFTPLDNEPRPLLSNSCMIGLTIGSTILIRKLWMIIYLPMKQIATILLLMNSRILHPIQINLFLFFI